MQEIKSWCMWETDLFLGKSGLVTIRRGCKVCPSILDSNPLLSSTNCVSATYSWTCFIDIYGRAGIRTGISNLLNLSSTPTQHCRPDPLPPAHRPANPGVLQVILPRLSQYPTLFCKLNLQGKGNLHYLFVMLEAISNCCKDSLKNPLGYSIS